MSGVRMGTPAGRWVLLATVLGSSIVMLGGTVVNVALERIGRELDADFAGLQWIVNAYTLALAGLILLGGALGDRFGRRRVFLVGVAWFAVASLLCAVAPSAGMLAGARALQGVGAAVETNPDGEIHLTRCLHCGITGPQLHPGPTAPTEAPPAR